jgi:predicted nucleic acid-binding Zn ribbon protein
MDTGLRRQTLSDWYGYDWRVPPPGGPRRIGESVDKVLADLGLGERLTEGQVSAGWREIVGDFLADHSKPSRIQAGVLYVQVIQSSIRYELERSWKRDLLARLAERFGKKRIREVRFVT